MIVRVRLAALTLLLLPSPALAHTASAGSVEESAPSPGGALETFKARHDAVMKLVKRGAKTKRVELKVDELLDYDWLAEASLGGSARYKNRCKERCDEFKLLLTRLIRENYLKRIYLGKNGRVEYVGEEKRGRVTKVTTRVKYKKDGRDVVVEIAYVMHKVGANWQVRDIITDGVSLARNYKYEFGKIIREESIDALVLRLENKLAEIAKTP